MNLVDLRYFYLKIRSKGKFMELNDLKKEKIWKHFLDFTRIPRPSGKEEAIRNHIISWAKEKGYEYNVDKSGNMIIRVPASKGCEKSPILSFQGHLDMVAEQNIDSKVDPNTDPLDVYIDDGWITARGTTLGADNGIGIAAAMAITEEPALKHAPLEILCTVDEETALTGAFALEKTFVKSRKMINLDTEELGIFYVGCAGGQDTTFILPCDFSPVPEGLTSVKITVSGLKGGHSGLDIHLGRANANKILGALLKSISPDVDLKLAYIQGGNKRNAIPRESKAHILINKSDESKFHKIIDDIDSKFQKEFSKTDQGLKITAQKASKYPDKALSVESQKKLLDLINDTRNGIVAMSKDIEGLVETSTNLGVMDTKENVIELVNCKRSSSSKAMKSLNKDFHALAGKYGADASDANAYPGWEPNMKSELLKIGKNAWKEKFGKEPHVTAVHAGLECGIIGEKYEGIDMIAFGPDITGAHSPDEKLNIESTNKFYEFLKLFVEKLS